MKTWAVAILVCLPMQILAGESWPAPIGTEINTALTDRKLVYEQAWQEFRISGRLLFSAGRDSWGFWRVRGDQYRSLWWLSDLRTCYDIARFGGSLHFIGAHGDVRYATHADD